MLESQSGNITRSTAAISSIVTGLLKNIAMMRNSEMSDNIPVNFSVSKPIG